MKFTLRTVSEIARPGHNTLTGVRVRKSLPSNNNRPQVGKSDGNPSPRNDSADSVMIALASPSVAETITGLRTLGRMCRVMTRRSRVPIERAASRWIVSSDPEEHVERLAETIGLGFTHLVFHAPGPDQRRFLDLYAEQILPRLRSRYDGAT